MTTAFHESAASTTVATSVLYDSREVRDAVMQSPMKDGILASNNRLAALLATLAGKAL